MGVDLEAGGIWLPDAQINGIMKACMEDPPDDGKWLWGWAGGTAPPGIKWEGLHGPDTEKIAEAIEDARKHLPQGMWRTIQDWLERAREKGEAEEERWRDYDGRNGR